MPRKKLTDEERREYHREYSRRWEEKNKPRLRALHRERHMQKKYGMSSDAYAAMVTAQNGVCAICLRPPSQKHGHLCVDHCHSTGRIRQLLCGHCNTSIGLLGEDEAVVMRALDYLRKWKHGNSADLGS